MSGKKSTEQKLLQQQQQRAQQQQNIKQFRRNKIDNNYCRLYEMSCSI